MSRFRKDKYSYTYEQQRDRFSLGLNGSYGKVGSTYIKVEADGKLTLAGDAKRFKEQHKHEKCWELIEEKNRRRVSLPRRR